MSSRVEHNSQPVLGEVAAASTAAAGVVASVGSWWGLPHPLCIQHLEEVRRDIDPQHAERNRLSTVHATASALICSQEGKAPNWIKRPLAHNWPQIGLENQTAVVKESSPGTKLEQGHSAQAFLFGKELEATSLAPSGDRHSTIPSRVTHANNHCRGCSRPSGTGDL